MRPAASIASADLATMLALSSRLMLPNLAIVVLAAVTIGSKTAKSAMPSEITPGPAGTVYAMVAICRAGQGDTDDALATRSQSLGVFDYRRDTIEEAAPGLAVILTLSQSETTRVPPITVERSPPLSRMTGADSPVIGGQ